MVEIRKKGQRLMAARYGAQSCAHHLVWVGAHKASPSAIRKRRGTCPRASMRSFSSVDASGNRWANNNNKNNNNYVRAVRK